MRAISTSVSRRSASLRVGVGIGIEGVAYRAAAPLALDGGDDMGALSVAEVDDGLIGGHGLSPLERSGRAQRMSRGGGAMTLSARPELATLA